VIWIAILILAVLLVIVLMQLFKKQPPATPSAPAPDLANLKVTDARVGDALSISGAGDNYADLDFTVDRATRYMAGQRAWTELSGPYRERRVALRVGGDEEVEAALHAEPKQTTLDDLGLSEDDLAQIDERQNTADNFEFDNKVWLYRLSREAFSQRQDQSQPAGFYYWEFREQDGPGLIAIRKAEGEPFAVTRYSVIPVGNVTVYRGL
jgi:hypothetical protein